MKQTKQHTIDRMNELGGKGIPFAFLIDFDFERPLICETDNSDELKWEIPNSCNYKPTRFTEKKVEWKSVPVDYEVYEKAFRLVQQSIHQGDTYLLNLTMPSRVTTNLSLEEIFCRSSAPYKIWLKDQFVCFSPEIFVRIDDGIISSYPMKGTIDANVENAAELLQTDRKEVAEHHTIVDLIRNDLSLVATDVQVEQLMYIDRIQTNRGELLQMSSKITGKLPSGYQNTIGTILSKMLPAGSVTGAPKARTIDIIRSAEHYQRGYYTGIFGVFDGLNLDSCVLIRYLEQDGDELIFKSGGGITFLSECRTEYDELKQKVYVPIT